MAVRLTWPADRSSRHGRCSPSIGICKPARSAVADAFQASSWHRVVCPPAVSEGGRFATARQPVPSVTHSIRGGCTLPQGSRLMCARHRQGFPCCIHSPCAYMPSPVPRRRRPACFVRPPLDGIGRWPLSPGPRRGILRVDVFEACSAFARVTPCTLAEPPDSGPFSPKCFSPCRYRHEPLRLLPARTNRLPGGSTPAGVWYLSTAYAVMRSEPTST